MSFSISGVNTTTAYIIENPAKPKKARFTSHVRFGAVEQITYSIYETVGKHTERAPLPIKIIESDPKRYAPKNLSAISLATLNSQPLLNVSMIGNTILSTWYASNNPCIRYCGTFIVALIEQAIDQCTNELPFQDVLLRCHSIITNKLQELRSTDDIVSPRQFLKLFESGWITKTPCSLRFLDDIKNEVWMADTERTIHLGIPDLEKHFTGILYQNEIKNAIKSYVTASFDPVA